ncbi:MAG: ribosome maturation factor RimM [Weeksellaceae bacterium]|jgi:16S rRNA processing protein RimM|nr:ribosome maturation factor RimM [Weeksellaceae bacterium]
MQKNDCYYLGKITKKHGFKGNLIVHLETDNPELYENMESVFIETNGILVPFFFETIGPHSKNKLLVKFEDISAEESEKLINRSLYLPLETLPELNGTDFYYHDIIGYKVIDAQKGEIGSIKNVNDSGIQALFEIDYNGKEILIPVVDEWILEVNKTEKFIKVETPEGLIDLYLA